MPDLTRKQKIHALKIARKYTAIKISLENPFKRELKTYFAQQTKRISRGQDIISIAHVLEIQYRRIVRKLTGIRLKEDDSEIEERILLILLGRAALQSMRIDKTTNKYLRRSIELARSELAESGDILPSIATINLIAANIMRGYNKNRVGSISVFETQALTEKIRSELTDIATEKMNIAIFEENQRLAQEAADLAESIRLQEIADEIGEISTGELFLALKLLEKTWVTMGDKKVRPWHKQANYQTVLIGEPFIVHGESLMYPGDMSLGASLKNVSGCRCSSINL